MSVKSRDFKSCAQLCRGSSQGSGKVGAAVCGAEDVTYTTDSQMRTNVGRETAVDGREGA